MISHLLNYLVAYIISALYVMLSCCYCLWFSRLFLYKNHSAILVGCISNRESESVWYSIAGADVQIETWEGWEGRLVSCLCHAFYVTVKSKHNTTFPLPTDVWYITEVLSCIPCIVQVTVLYICGMNFRCPMSCIRQGICWWVHLNWWEFIEDFFLWISIICSYETGNGLCED